MNAALRVAVADDELMMRLYLQDILPALGYEVVAVAENGEDLVHQVETTRPDLVITDIRMPVLDGLKAVERICTEKPLPVVLVSGHDYGAQVRRAEESCVLVYLTKPVSCLDIEGAVKAVLERYSLFRELVDEGLDVGEAIAALRVIGEAKTLLAYRFGLSRPQALKQLRAMAVENGSGLTATAKRVLADGAGGKEEGSDGRGPEVR